MWTFAAELWHWQAREDSWTFVSLPEQAADEILEATQGLRRGFGSVRVQVTCGATTWSTSVFPSKADGTYVLPVKKAVQKAESIHAGSTASFTVALVP